MEWEWMDSESKSKKLDVTNQKFMMGMMKFDSPDAQKGRKTTPKKREPINFVSIDPKFYGQGIDQENTDLTMMPNGLDTGYLPDDDQLSEMMNHDFYDLMPN